MIKNFIITLENTMMNDRASNSPFIFQNLNEGSGIWCFVAWQVSVSNNFCQSSVNIYKTDGRIFDNARFCDHSRISP